jgi:hypothetical protein
MLSGMTRCGTGPPALLVAGEDAVADAVADDVADAVNEAEWVGIGSNWGGGKGKVRLGQCNRT